MRRSECNAYAYTRLSLSCALHAHGLRITAFLSSTARLQFVLLVRMRAVHGLIQVLCTDEK